MKALQLIASLAVALATSTSAFAQELPTRPIRMVVAYPAGGSSDPVARGLAAGLSKRIDQSVFVENKPGGNTVIATQIVATAPADGTTLYQTFTTPYTMIPHLLKKVPYEPREAMTPIAAFGEMSFGLVVPAASPFKTVQDLVSAAKASPGKLTFPSPGTAQIIGLASELFKSGAGIDAVHVPYQGSGPAISGLLAGQHDFFLSDLGTINQFVKAGKVRLLATVGTTRHANYPEIPTMAESGFKSIVIPPVWMGVVGPPNMNAQLVQKLNNAITQEMMTPEMQRIMHAQLLTVTTSTPEQLAKYVQQDDITWGGLIKKLGIKLD